MAIAIRTLKDRLRRQIRQRGPERLGQIGLHFSRSRHRILASFLATRSRRYGMGKFKVDMAPCHAVLSIFVKPISLSPQPERQMSVKFGKS